MKSSCIRLTGVVLRRTLLSTCFISALHSIVHAVPANPHPTPVTQPDGTTISIVLRGDEYRHWHEDAAGYTILKDTATRHWVYAQKEASGALRPGSHKVGASDPEKLGFKKRLADDERVKAGAARRAQIEASSPFRVLSSRATVSSASPRSQPSRAPILTGTMKNLVILARFSDQAPVRTKAEFNSLFNDIGYNADGAAGSVKDYFLEVSYGSLTMQSVVTEWVTLPNTQAYYGADVGGSGNDDKPREMAADAINNLRSQYPAFDFSTADGNGDGQVDGLDIIHSGFGQEAGGDSDRIWSHQWNLVSPITYDGVTMDNYHTEPELRDNSGSGLSRIGVICHETGHFLGLPDLYDTADPQTSSGLGDFCLMSGGGWNGSSGDGASPAHMSAWCKKTLGWATPTQLTTVGTKSLPRIEDNSSAMYLLRDSSFSPNEYFLIENRQGFGFDAYLPGSQRGILIWHVNEDAANNQNPEPYYVDLEEASGTQDLTSAPGLSGDDSDYFRSGNNTAFSDTTSPNSKTYAGAPLKLPISAVSASAATMTFYLTGVPETDIGSLRAYPNPCDFRAASYSLTIDGIPADAAGTKVYIYSEAGELVRILAPGDGINGLNIASWNGRLKGGARAASGLYIYLVKTSNYGKGRGKFFIVW